MRIEPSLFRMRMHPQSPCMETAHNTERAIQMLRRNRILSKKEGNQTSTALTAIRTDMLSKTAISSIRKRKTNT